MALPRSLLEALRMASCVEVAQRWIGCFGFVAPALFRSMWRQGESAAFLHAAIVAVNQVGE